MYFIYLCKMMWYRHSEEISKIVGNRIKFNMANTASKLYIMQADKIALSEQNYGCPILQITHTNCGKKCSFFMNAWMHS